MKVNLIETQNGKNVAALILPAHSKEMPLKKDGWRFNWKNLAQIEGSLFFKIVLQQTPAWIEGMLMLTLINEEMLFMNNIEVAPHNYGLNGKYDGVAACLLAYACRKSFELGKGNYLGYLAFESKTELIALYQGKYGATWAIGQKMYFDPEAGKKLILQYLK